MKVADGGMSSRCARVADEDGRVVTGERTSLLETWDAEDNVRGRLCDIVFVPVADEIVCLRLGTGAVLDGRVRVRRGVPLPSETLLF